MRSTFLLSLVCCTLPLIGCARGNVELLESRLRSRDSELRSLHGQLELKDQELARSQREIQLLQQQLADQSATPEAVARLARIEKIAINSQLTGALDQDGRPGDDLLNVVVSPLDASGDVVKLDGEIEIEALDAALPENKRSLGKWNIGLEDAENAWHDGFIGQGYQLTAPWQRVPQSKEIVLLARYKTPDGREFSTTRNIRVNPAQGDEPDLLPLPQAKQDRVPPPEVSSSSPEIEQVSFEEFVKEREASMQKGSASKEEDTAEQDDAPVITPSSAPLVELKPPIETAERPVIPLPEVLAKPEERDMPPFVEQPRRGGKK